MFFLYKGTENQVMQTIFDAQDFVGHVTDKWLTLIAFCGFAAHRTTPIQPNELHPGCYFKSDVSFLYKYAVRSGYNKYGAIAYFDNKFCIKKIFISYTGKTYTPRSYVRSEWEHAKWHWKVCIFLKFFWMEFSGTFYDYKVSVTVATFLVDMVAQSRFREGGGLLRAIHETLSVNHPVRRLLLPFTFGTVYANRVFNEYLKEHGLFHRIFAFQYKALSQLILDAMGNSQPISGLSGSGNKSCFEENKYRFRLVKV